MWSAVQISHQELWAGQRVGHALRAGLRSGGGALVPQSPKGLLFGAQMELK